MSRRYKGAVISATPPTTTGGESGTAPGEWTLQSQAQAQGGGIWPTPPQPKYIEDVFSTYVYTGSGAARSINNGIDLSTKGGMVWFKGRNVNYNHALFDTSRGVNKWISSNTTNAEQGTAYPNTLTAFNTDGFSLGVDNAYGVVNYDTSSTYVSWSFRKQAKFFDVVTWTGNASSRTISHSLGSVPACIIVKCTSEVNEWVVYHRSLSTPESSYLKLASTAAVTTGNTYIWDNTAPTSTVFSVGASGFTNNTGQTYVAYLFAHDAGGFGLTGTDNVISCGSFTMPSSGNYAVTLGYEPQWVLAKRASSTGSWVLTDNMRNMSYKGFNELIANTSNAEGVDTTYSEINPTATGFIAKEGTTGSIFYPGDYIYIAIRRGPMKVPTDATKVFNTFTGGDFTPITTGFPVDAFLDMYRPSSLSIGKIMASRLTGSQYLITSSTNAEATNGNPILWDSNTTVTPKYLGYSGTVVESFRRAPSFFDQVCYTGTGTNQTQNHNLGVEPELWISKVRNGADDWSALAQFTSTGCKYGNLNLDGGFGDLLFSNAYSPFSARPSSTSFSLRALASGWNNSGSTYVAYLFATCAGVSKVGTYTGTGTLTTINCGFAGGARFVLIKRTDSTSNWFVWDTARGMVSGTDPSLSLNTTSAESNANSVYTATTGFQLLASPSADVNTSGGSYIFLAIA